MDKSGGAFEMEQEEEDRAKRLILPIVTLPLTGTSCKSGSPLQSVKCIPKELTRKASISRIAEVPKVPCFPCWS
jgi:hypothetical protein